MGCKSLSIAGVISLKSHVSGHWSLVTGHLFNLPWQLDSHVTVKSSFELFLSHVLVHALFLIPPKTVCNIFMVLEFE